MKQSEMKKQSLHKYKIASNYSL